MTEKLIDKTINVEVTRLDDDLFKFKVYGWTYRTKEWTEKLYIDSSANIVLPIEIYLDGAFYNECN